MVLLSSKANSEWSLPTNVAGRSVPITSGSGGEGHWRAVGPAPAQQVPRNRSLAHRRHRITGHHRCGVPSCDCAEKLLPLRHGAPSVRIRPTTQPAYTFSSKHLLLFEESLACKDVY